MPVMNGLDAARMLRRLGDKFVEQQAKFIGIAALIPKTEPAGTLVGTAQVVLGQRRATAR